MAGNRQSNKHASIQALLVARDCRNGDLAKEQTEYNRKRRAEVILNGGSCLTCKHTTSQRGVFLFCSKKAKKVNQYNFCEQWFPLVSEESKNVK